MSLNCIKIKKDFCKGCGLCIKHCPFGVLEMSESFNAFGGHYVKQIENKECKGCGRCYIVCPDCAIEVLNG